VKWPCVSGDSIGLLLIKVAIVRRSYGREGRDVHRDAAWCAEAASEMYWALRSLLFSGRSSLQTGLRHLAPTTLGHLQPCLCDVLIGTAHGSAAGATRSRCWSCSRPALQVLVTAHPTSLFPRAATAACTLTRITDSLTSKAVRPVWAYPT
jgi:hypothetical protein